VVSRAIDGLLDLTSDHAKMPLSAGATGGRQRQARQRYRDGHSVGGAFDQLGRATAICKCSTERKPLDDPYMESEFCKAINDWIAAEMVGYAIPACGASIVGADE